MSPQAALEAQIARYREMTPEQRVLTALRLHELACEMARVGIRRQHPDAQSEEVERRLRERHELARAAVDYSDRIRGCSGRQPHPESKVEQMADAFELSGGTVRLGNFWMNPLQPSDGFPNNPLGVPPGSV